MIKPPNAVGAAPGAGQRINQQVLPFHNPKRYARQRRRRQITGRVYLPGHPRYAAQQRAANPLPELTGDELNDDIGF